MGFYIEEIPTEFNGMTMQEADYLADEFLKDEPCNRMWDAMRALRDFYETVMNEAVEVAEQTEPSNSEKPNNCEWCKFFDGENCYSQESCKAKDEPQTCEECEHWNDTEDGCADRHGCKTEPQTDK